MENKIVCIWTECPKCDKTQNIEYKRMGVGICTRFASETEMINAFNANQANDCMRARNMAASYRIMQNQKRL